MALYTKLSKSEITTLVARFGLHAPTQIKGVLEGTVNTYYRLTYNDLNRVFYLKIDEIGDKQRLHKELAILETLSRSSNKLGFKTPSPLPVQKKSPTEYAIKFGKKFVLLFPEVMGQSLMEDELKENHLFEIGKALGTLHKLKIPSQITPHRFHVPELKKVFSQIEKKLLKKHPKVHTLISQIFKDIESKSEDIYLPEGLIHADLFPENILFSNDRIEGIIDFEAGGLGALLFDICVTLHACCHDGKKFNVPKIKSFLKGYLTIRKLSQNEWSCFPLYLKESALRFLLTRLRDFELKDGPVKAKPFKDFKEYVRRFDEIEALIPHLKAH